MLRSKELLWAQLTFSSTRMLRILVVENVSCARSLLKCSSIVSYLRNFALNANGDM